MANGKTWNPNTRMYEAIDFDRQPEVKDEKECRRCGGQGWYMGGYYGATRFDCGCKKKKQTK